MGKHIGSDIEEGRNGFRAVLCVCHDSQAHSSSHLLRNESSSLMCPLLLLLLLSHFNRVRLCATPEMVAHQAPPSLGFFRQEHWSGLPFPYAPTNSTGELKIL